MGRTLYDKIWDDHLVANNPDGTSLIYIDRHLVDQVPVNVNKAGPILVVGHKVIVPDLIVQSSAGHFAGGSTRG